MCCACEKGFDNVRVDEQIKIAQKDCWPQMSGEMKILCKVNSWKQSHFKKSSTKFWVLFVLERTFNYELLSCTTIDAFAFLYLSSNHIGVIFCLFADKY